MVMVAKQLAALENSRPVTTVAVAGCQTLWSKIFKMERV